MTPAARQRARRGEGERLRGEILAAAEELLTETGDESAVSIRAIAERVGITAPSIYRHFADKDQLLFAVCAQIFARVDQALEKAATGASDPIDEIGRKGRAYVEFGLTFPESYRLLFMLHPPEKAHQPDGSEMAGTTAFHHLMDSVSRMLDLAPDQANRTDTYATTCAVWTAVHGITSLRISWPDFPWPPVEQQIELVCRPWHDAYGMSRRGARRTGSASTSTRRAPGVKAPIVAFHEALAALRVLSLRHSKVCLGQAWVSGDTELVRVQGERRVDVKLGRAAIRRRQAEFAADPRVEVSDDPSWVSVRLESTDDAVFAAGLVRLAAEPLASPSKSR
ncbi:MAG: TetR family transcriptional regulator [Acidimicrobiales bacterium]